MRTVNVHGIVDTSKDQRRRRRTFARKRVKGKITRRYLECEWGEVFFSRRI
jgi:hypothetical protein